MRIPDAYRAYRERVKRGEIGPGELEAFVAGASWGVNEAADWLASPRGRAGAQEPDWMERVRKTVAGRLRNWLKDLYG